ncbi:MAG: hypothetical protein E6G51_06740 [Actinobacteria bacterium]|nr:MAG: hypothetical protein E6G51_06740 [Actinomycetota bacterium]
MPETVKRRPYVEDKARRFVVAGFDVVDRRRAEEEVGIAFVVGVDRDQASLGVARAAQEGEVDWVAGGEDFGVAKQSLGGVEGDVLRDFGPDAAEFEVGEEVWVTAGLRGRAGRFELVDRHRRLSRCGAGADRQQAGHEGDEVDRLPTHGAYPSPAFPVCGASSCVS